MSAQEKMAAVLSTTLQLVQMCSITLCVMSFTFFQSHLCFLVYSGKTNNVHLFPTPAIYAVLHFVLWLNNGTVWMVNTCTYSVCQFRFSTNSLKSKKKYINKKKILETDEELRNKRRANEYLGQREVIHGALTLKCHAVSLLKTIL